MAAPPPQPDLARGDVVEEHVELPGFDISLLRPRSSDALLDEHAFEREEYLPYWAELWPSGVALARELAVRALRGARTLELGCGLGLASTVAALAGGRILATDWSPDAVRFTRENALRNGAGIEAEVCSWLEPAAIVGRGPWDLVIAADVLYEGRAVEVLLELLPRLMAERGEIVIADPGRPPAAAFVAAAKARWSHSARADSAYSSVTIHRLRGR